MIHPHLKGKKVVELGSGRYPQKHLLQRLDVSDYTSVDIHNSGFDFYVKSDALEFLLKQDDESAVIVSFGFICPEIWPIKKDCLDIHKSKLDQYRDPKNSEAYDYLRFICKEIHRVTPRDSITIHSQLSTYVNHSNLIIDSGFKPLTDNPKCFPLIY